MTDATNENETTPAAEASTLERAAESVEASSLFESAPAAFGEWVSETREVMNRHWGQALERARTRLEAAAPAAAPETPVAEDAEPAAPTPLHRLLQSAIVTRAQERGAAILLGSARKLRAQLEQLEANLEAARPSAA